MLSWPLLLAAGLSVVIGAAHSILGEHRLIGPLLAAPAPFGTRTGSACLRMTLRYAWHLTSLLFVGMAGVLTVLALVPAGAASFSVLMVVGATAAASAAITASYSRGRHPAWPMLAAIALLVWWSATQGDAGALLAATAPGIGLAVAVTFLVIGGVHAWWALRGTTGSPAVIPERDGRPLFRPGRLATGLVAAGLAAAGILASNRLLALAPILPWELVVPARWALAALLVLRAVGDFRFVGLFKRVTDTRFGYWDTIAYTPLCLLLGIAVGVVAWTG